MTRRERRGEETRARIFEAALASFRERGFARTTMRDVAQNAGTSLGSAYYHFGSKEQIVHAYYDRVTRERLARVTERLEGVDDLETRIRLSFHTHFDIVAADRRLLGALVQSVADPESPVSIFSADTVEVRERVLRQFEAVVDVPQVPEHLRDLAVLALWVLDLALVLYFIWDASPDRARTRQLIDDAVTAIMPLVPLLASPFAEPMIGHLARTLVRAGLVPTGRNPE
ncbi:MAG: TetR/AcrR family transcriptional regulator [Myxococcota bacterium]